MFLREKECNAAKSDKPLKRHKEYKKVILNEVSPWHASGTVEAEEMNVWIKVNLHDKIKELINSSR